MRRESRKKRVEETSLTDKIILYVGIGVAILAVIVIALLIYSQNLSDEVRNETMSLEQMANIANNSQNTQSNTESASTEIGKSVEESANTLNTNNTNSTSKTNTANKTNTVKTNNSNSSSSKKTNTNSNTTSTNNVEKNTVNENKVENTKKELSFQKPVEGDIVREYAKDNLIFSDTLQEWTTHMGIDIKASKTTVVNASEAGTVKSIKNDPRYGLTIAIEHENGFQTIYSNLLTSEFVVEGEKVEKGQPIGTVGNTGIFEVADEPHLHFEILKDSLQVDPSLYIK